jgi:hypothetical protein
MNASNRLAASKHRVSHLTTVQFARLNHACLLVYEAFGFGSTYLVGSALYTEQYRDVDVRVILSDEEFDAIFAGRVFLWSLLCLSVSSYLTEVSGLPVDFQIQRSTEANAKFNGMRNPIGTRARPFAGGGDATGLMPQLAADLRAKAAQEARS